MTLSLQDIEIIRKTLDETDVWDECDKATDRLLDEISRLNKRVSELEEIVNTSENDEFIAAIAREGEHQRMRWNDDGKTDWDWFWLIGYLSQKAATSKSEKRKHHIITTCAALLNWHRSALKKMPPALNTKDV